MFISISLSTISPLISTDQVQPPYHALAIHENNSTSPVPTPAENLPATTQHDIPTAADLPRTLSLSGSSEIKLKLTAALDTERRLEQNIDNSTELFLINEWFPRISFQFEEGSKVGLIDVKQVLIGKTKSYDSYQDVITNSTLWKDIPLNEDVVLRFKDKGIYFIIAEVQFVNGISALYSGMIDIDPMQDKTTRERVLQAQLKEDANLKVIPPSVPNISESDNLIFSQSTHEIICGILKQYGFLVCTANDLPSKTKSITKPNNNNVLDTSNNTVTNLTSTGQISKPSSIANNLSSIGSKPDNNIVESTRLILNDAIQDIQNGDNEKALLYLDLVRNQIMIMTRDNITTLSNSATILLDDAIERLQNGDSNAALLYLDLINKQLPGQTSDNQTSSSTNITTDRNEKLDLAPTGFKDNKTIGKRVDAAAIDTVPLNQTVRSTNQNTAASIESLANNTIKGLIDNKSSPVQIQKPPTIHTYNLTRDNMTFPIKYLVNNATINNITLNRHQASMIMDLSTTDNGMLNIELPRNVIDSKDNRNLDEDYLVLTDGLQVDYEQASSNDQLRNISIDFEKGVEEVEIQGTEIFGVEPVHTNLVTQQLAAETTTNNQTSFPGDIEKLRAAGQAATETGSLMSNASDITIGPTIIDDRQASLFVKVDAPILTLEGIRKGGQLLFRLFDPSNNQTIKFVTYEIAIRKVNASQDSRPILRDFFHAPNGLLAIKVDPTESGSLQIFGDRDPFQNALIADPGGTVNLRGPILIDNGAYHIQVKIFGIDNIRNIFLPENAPRFEVKVTLQNNNNSNTSYQAVIQNTTNYQPIEPTFEDTLRNYSNYACGIDVQYPEYWIELNASEVDRDQGTIVYFSPAQPDAFAYLSISMTDVPSTRTLRGFSIQTIDTLERIEPNFKLLESNSTSIGNLPSHQIIYTSTSVSDTNQTELYKSLVVWTIEDDRAYRFRFDSNNFSTFDYYLPDARSIINSTQITTPGEDISDDYTVMC